MYPRQVIQFPIFEFIYMPNHKHAYVYTKINNTRGFQNQINFESRYKFERILFIRMESRECISNCTVVVIFRKRNEKMDEDHSSFVVFSY